MNEAQTRFNKIDPKLREMIRGSKIRGAKTCPLDR